MGTNIKKHHRYCRQCHVNHVIDPTIGSTWAETVDGFVPQSWCPGCGQMLPLLNIDDDVEEKYEYVSKKAKQLVAVKTAEIHNLNFKSIYQILDGFRGLNIKEDFVAEFARAINLIYEININEDEIKSFF